MRALKNNKFGLQDSPPLHVGEEASKKIRAKSKGSHVLGGKRKTQYRYGGYQFIPEKNQPRKKAVLQDKNSF